jgi:polysaccharide export outer membrane protein
MLQRTETMSWNRDRLLMRRIVLLLALCAAMLARVPAAAAAPDSRKAHALHISSGDLLEVTVFDTPELSGRLRVDSDGAVMLPVAGKMPVAGLTADEAAAAIEKKLRSTDIMKDPHVTVLVAEYATQGVTVSGEVKNPGIYPMLGSHGLMDMLSAAGGVTAQAGSVVSITHRSDPKHPEIVKLDDRPGKMVENVDIEPGDIIMVARGGVAYAVGDVQHAGGFLIEGRDRVTVLQMLALAGGTTKTSSQNHAHLIRTTQNGREDIPVKLKDMMKGKEADIPLQDGDILFVPSSKGKIFAYRGVDSAIAMTTGLVVGGRL